MLVVVIGLMTTNYAEAYYNSKQGRWQSRDLIEEEGGLNVYGVVGNNSINKVDYFGLWGSNVHYDRTRLWSLKLGMSRYGAQLIAEQDDGVDKVFSPLQINNSNWSWHFDRSTAGVDSRLEHFEQEIQIALVLCNWKRRRMDNWYEAALHIGRALHPLQDWVAHGDFNRNRQGEESVLQGVSFNENFRYIHNYDSPGSGGSSMPDDLSRDARGASGRATIEVLHRTAPLSNGDVPRWAFFYHGSRRINLTEQRTKWALNRFIKLVRSYGKSCGECQKAFAAHQPQN
jgi:hypothetical protein